VVLADGSTGGPPDDGAPEPIRITADHLVIASGSRPIALPGLEFGSRVMSSTGALSLTKVPTSMAVVGGGYIGVELGTALAKLGTHVTIVEAEDRLLPLYDVELTTPVARRLDELDVSVMTSSRADGLSEGGLRVLDGDGTAVEVAAETILVTVGRQPNTDGWGLEGLGLRTDGPFIVIDDQCRTSMRDVWAIGDVTGEPMLAHRAMRQGEVVAEAIAGRPAAFDPEVIPAIVFSDPEIVVVGLSPAEAEAQYGETLVGQFPLSANGRAMTLERAAGFVRIVARADNHLVVGIQAVGASVAELSASFSLAIEVGAQLEDVAGTIHAHPTLSEALPEAAQTALGHPLHF
ncbi:MAG: FAD-dependent oxidoreductase, partial [Actinomycetia bacterium]|nr:FAD-dependent oxidoreductase [Actinomycetes bacterium]